MEMWDVTMLTMHVAMVVIGWLLVRGAPCWMQQLAIGMVILGMVIAVFAFGFALAGHPEYHWPFFIVALVIEHLAVMLWLFRLFKDKYLCLPNCSAPSQPSRV